jgi:prolyl-tRNA editing enzyme YbaK/EbsC (Cys-tRNA(Pro) deacylase)
MHERAAEFAERVRAAHDLDVQVETFPEGTKTAVDAAEALSCDVGQIASSIVFGVEGGVPNALYTDTDRAELVVVVTSGANHVSEAKLAELLEVDEDAVSPADPDAISETLGWSIGGVPPVCHDADVPVYLDRDLLDHETVWAAAGTPTAVFPIDPTRLRAVTGAPVVDVTE